jgi:hypothetical protein
MELARPIGMWLFESGWSWGFTAYRPTYEESALIDAKN